MSGLPYHLSDDAPPLAECNRCGRKTWDESGVGIEDRMPQPDGNPCGGRFVPPREGGGSGDVHDS